MPPQPEPDLGAFCSTEGRLCFAGMYHALPAASLAVHRDVAVAHDTNAKQDQAEANDVLILLWRRVGCVAILLLSDCCGQACRLHEAYQNKLQEQVLSCATEV